LNRSLKQIISYLKPALKVSVEQACHGRFAMRSEWLVAKERPRGLFYGEEEC
jgi:hypothetical protein